jgi:hypothetical protein
MLKMNGNVIVNEQRLPIAVVEGDTVLIRRFYWRDSIMRGKISELCCGKKQCKMPEELYISLVNSSSEKGKC